MEDPQEKEQVVIGIGWYRSDQWQLLREFSSDADELEETYAEWETEAAKAFDYAKNPGVLVVKVDVDVEELLSWCQQQGVAVNADARAKFILLKTQKQGKASVARTCSVGPRLVSHGQGKAADLQSRSALTYS